MHRSEKLKKLLYAYAKVGKYEFTINQLRQDIITIFKVTPETASRYIKEMETWKLIETVPGSFNFRNIYCKCEDNE
ncbi:MAG: hypothetical protein EOL97_15535 [Spirochaetia bacterium]|nr:hypothetical protein [Spirochaetia bacterium]